MLYEITYKKTRKANPQVASYFLPIKKYATTFLQNAKGSPGTTHLFPIRIQKNGRIFYSLASVTYFVMLTFLRRVLFEGIQFKKVRVNQKW